MLHLQHGDEGVRRFTVDPGPLGWMVSLLMEAGPVDRDVTMGGVVFRPISWTQLRDWSLMTGTDLSPDTARGLMVLSAAYAEQLNASTALECKAPYEPPKAEKPTD